MPISVVDFDTFIVVKNKPKEKVFVFLLGDEYKYLEQKTHWLGHLEQSVYLVRLQQPEFQMLDIGVHPKVIIIEGGKETFEHNGIPDIGTLKRGLR